MSPSITVASPDLADFIHTLGINELGEGDAYRGIHAFLCMCNVLCALDPNQGVQVTNGPILPTGLNLLLTDPVTSSIVHDKVIEPLQIEQQEILRTSRKRQKAEQAALTRVNNKQCVDGLAVGNALRKVMAESGTHSSLSLYNNLTNNNPWSAAYSDMSNDANEEAQEHPLLLAMGVESKALISQVEQAHSGKAVVWAPFSRVEELNKADSVFNQLMAGTLIGRDPLRPLQGKLITTMIPAVAYTLFEPEVTQSTWQIRMGWLFTETLKVPPPAEGHRTTFSLEKAYRVALRRMIEHRLKGGTSYDDMKIHPSWAKGHATRLRTITQSTHLEMRAFRPLLVTMIKGLLFMERACDTTFPWNKWIPEVWRLLIQSADATLTRLRSRVQEQKDRAFLEKLVTKLSEEPLTARDIVRKFHHLPIEQCRTGLQTLERQERAQQVGGKWRIPGDSSDQQPKQVTIDVPHA